MEHQDLREKLARVARQMIETGLLTETSGNISPRTPEGDILVTPSGIDYEILDPEDVVLVDVQGKILDGSLEPTGEILMHTGVHRARSRAGAVVYTTPAMRPR